MPLTGNVLESLVQVFRVFTFESESDDDRIAFLDELDEFTFRSEIIYVALALDTWIASMIASCLVQTLQECFHHTRHIGRQCFTLHSRCWTLTDLNIHLVV